MNILHINIRLSEGGAATIARDLHDRGLRSGHRSVLTYGYGIGARPSQAEYQIPNSFHLTTRPRAIGNYLASKMIGIDVLRPAARHRRRFLEELHRADIVHLHAIHSHMLSYRWLFSQLLEARKPVVWTMHDNWILTGRCAISATCEAWQRGCGRCAHKDYYPATLFDLSASEHQEKRHYIERLRGQLTHVSLSQFMESRLKLAFPEHAIVRIPNGIDQAIQDHLAKVPPPPPRERLKVLIAASDLSDPVKQDHMLLNHLIANAPCDFVTVGRNSPFSGPNVENLSSISNREQLAKIYVDADALIFTSRIDSFPLTVLESLCAGTPVLALDSPATREILSALDVSPVGPEEILELLSADGIRTHYRSLSRQEIQLKSLQHFSNATMGNRYFELYEKILNSNNNTLENHKA